MTLNGEIGGGEVDGTEGGGGEVDVFGKGDESIGIDDGEVTEAVLFEEFWGEEHGGEASRWERGGEIGGEIESGHFVC